MALPSHEYFHIFMNCPLTRTVIPTTLNCGVSENFAMQSHESAVHVLENFHGSIIELNYTTKKSLLPAT